MDSFNLHSLDPVALEQTMAYLKANPEPRMEDKWIFSFGEMLDDAVKEKDWMAEEMGQSSSAIVAAKAPGSDSLTTAFENESQFTPAASDLAFPVLQQISAPHMDVLKAEILGMIRYPSRCLWAGCKSKAVFKRDYPYKSHLRNIHIRPLLCTVPECSYKRLFRNEADLSRHVGTVHSNQRYYQCPYESCEAEPKAFARHDKLLKHIRDTEHQNDAFCPYYHCRLSLDSLGGFTDRKQIASHFRIFHATNKGDAYECTLGSCATVIDSDYWCMGQLANHLSEDHGIDDSWRIVMLMEIRVLEQKHLVDEQSWHDCALCLNSGTSPRIDDNMGI